ncbi:hypothetical protein BT96DRAFT_1016674 [Gymnopus androsaceus JB14]|uniref:F-box domain-containing protein n=1 Tax=Gymnopus androsaceus JB14 TaxID=1447944 RepID=A0A6A4I1H0_9AGAR|nr:hypothetical protein BT96DRAFT_1016674 [Gymnopus androsaceus JB14]
MQPARQSNLFDALSELHVCLVKFQQLLLHPHFLLSPTMLSELISLQDLPNELLYKIIDLLEPSDLQTLSSAVRKLRPLVDPTLYAIVEIKLFDDSIRFICNEHRVKPTKSQLQYARSLFITTDQPYYPNDKLGPTKRWKDRINLPALFGPSAEKPLHDLRDVMLSLDKVKFVGWRIPFVRQTDGLSNGTSLNFNSILKLLASLPSLDTFTFDVYNYPNPVYLAKKTRFGLENLHGLKSLSFTGFGNEAFWSAIIDTVIVVVRNSPELEELSLPLVKGGYGKLSLEYFLRSFPTTQPLTLRKLSLGTNVRNLRIDRTSGIRLKNLTNLNITSLLGPALYWVWPHTMNEGLWAVLGHYRIKLKHIYAPVTAELIDYLQTYSGVESLRLYGTADGVLAQRFCGVLRLHTASLKVMDTGPWTHPDSLALTRL